MDKPVLRSPGTPHHANQITIGNTTVGSHSNVFVGSNTTHIPENKPDFCRYILNCLKFPTIFSRKEHIAPAYAKTFEWIFDAPRWFDGDKFVDWLKDTNGTIFWINGKPGSGKSTLMKFIYDEIIKRKLLNDWAGEGEVPLVVVGHFFWNSGAELQMTGIGLLRVLLYEILRIHRNLIPIAFRSQKEEDWFDDDTERTWSLSELQDALQIVVEQPIRICFLIDGLDEYRDDPVELLDMFKLYSQRPNVKVCLSSRPLQVFIDDLLKFPQLKLQDLTREDMELYVSRKLARDRRWEIMRAEDVSGTEILILNLAIQADGVFLWTELVVKSLMNGLRDQNSLYDLKQRVELLPSNLQDLYTQMLGSIHEIYRCRSSRLFQVFRAANEYMHGVGALTVSFSVPYPNTAIAMQQPIKELSVSKLTERYDKLAVNLRTWCAGLLEYSTSELVEKEVVYIHRTARDFIEQDNTWAMIQSWSEGAESYSPFESLPAAYLLRLKTYGSTRSQERDSTFDLFWDIFETFKKCKVPEFGDHKNSFFKILDEFGRTAEVHWQTWAAKRHRYFENNDCVQPYAWTRYVSSYRLKHDYNQGPQFQDHNAILSIAVQAGQLAYIKAKTKENPKLLRNWRDRSLLDHACNDHWLDVFDLSILNMVSYLLECGVSPNEESGKRRSTPWTNCMVELERYNNSHHDDRDYAGRRLLMQIQMSTLLVEKDADVKAYCRGRRDYQGRGDYVTALHIINKGINISGWLNLRYPTESSHQIANQKRHPGTDKMHYSKKTQTDLKVACLGLKKLLTSKGAEDKVLTVEQWKVENKLHGLG